MIKPLFTILTSTFNAGSAVNIAAASVRAQCRSDVEYIIIDGASSDDTLEHVERNRDVITHVISEPDTGIYDALNKGIRAARGELIGIIGADDSLVTGALDIVAEAFARRPSDLYAGQTLLTTPDGRGVLRADEEFGVAALVSGIPFGHNAMFARRDAYDRVGLYDTGYRICADAQWVHRAVRAGMSCELIPRVLLQFSDSGVSTLDSTGILKESYDAIIENFPSLKPDDAETLLYSVRGWSDPMDLVPLLQAHGAGPLWESVAAAFKGKPDTWRAIEARVGAHRKALPSVVRVAQNLIPSRAPRARCEQPVFSFIIPAYNVEQFIGRCLDSILTQPFDAIEVIVVDDGSTDETAAVVEHYLAKDQRVRLIKQDNAGQGAARAVAMAEARGTYLWCVDSDDRIQDRVLDRIAGIMAATAADVVVLNFAYEEEDGSQSYSTLVPPWLAGRTVDPMEDERTFAAVSAWTCPPWRYVIRTELLAQAKITFHRGLFYEDHPFAIDLISAARSVHVDPTISYFYLQRAGSTVRSADKRFYDFLQVRRLVLDRLHDKGLTSRFPDIVTSYVLPINFVKAHVRTADRPDFLTKLLNDIRDDELAAVHAFGRSGELSLLAAFENGTLADFDIDAVEGSADRAGETLELSRTLSVGDVQGLSWREGPYPEIGIDQIFQWIDGDKLRLRLKVEGMERPVVRLRYRNAQPGQLLLIEQNGDRIEMLPCRSVGIDKVGEISIPVVAGQMVITIRKLDSSSGRRLGLALQEIDLIDAADPAGLAVMDASAGGERIVVGAGTRHAALHVDVRRDVQPRTYVKIGQECDIAGQFVFERGLGTITIGDRSSIGGGCLFICTQDAGISIGSNVMLSWDVTITDTNAHSLDPEIRANDAFDWLIGETTGRRGLYKDWANVKSAPVVIKDGAWVGFGCAIMKGVTIGVGAVVGAKSVVTKDVADFAIVAGNPARVVGTVPHRQVGDIPKLAVPHHPVRI